MDMSRCSPNKRHNHRISEKQNQKCLVLSSTNFVFLALIFSVCAETSEKNINSKWCDEIKGYSEFRTKYGTYVDCLTDIYAVEAEYDYNCRNFNISHSSKGTHANDLDSIPKLKYCTNN